MALFIITCVLVFFGLLLIAATLRVLAIKRSLGTLSPPKKKGAPYRLLIVLGSGGHTQEMLYMMEDLETFKFTHRTWVVSSGDAFSAERAHSLEQLLEEKERKLGWTPYTFRNGCTREEIVEQENKIRRNEHGFPLISYAGPQNFDVAVVPRARKVYQSLLTTPLSALRCLWSCFPVLLGWQNSTGRPPCDEYDAAARDLPDAIVTNGPATAVIMVLAALILRFFDIRGAQSRGKMKTIYVESFARVTTLSLSGKLLHPLVDHFVVQWPQLLKVAKRAKYNGVLVFRKPEAGMIEDKQFQLSKAFAGVKGTSFKIGA